MGQDGPSVVFEDNQGSFSHRPLQARHFPLCQGRYKGAASKEIPRDDFNHFRSWMEVKVFE